MEQKNMLQKLQRIVAWMCRKGTNVKTLRGQQWVGRNEPCVCGSGLKFKKCCWSKYAVLREGTLTPEMAKYIKKQDAYFKKRQRRHNG